MCLSNSEKIKTEEDITVYKTFCKVQTEQVCYYYTPFMGYPWDMGELKSIEKKCPHYEHNDSSRIGGDAFHSFKDKEGALALREYLIRVFGDADNRTFCICKCVIPKDTLYVYKGLSDVSVNRKADSYASHDLQLVEEV